MLLVFAHHIDQNALPGGFIGVDVFFVLSGYLITALLLRERGASGEIGLRQFYARRALRLYPALVVLVVVVTPIAAADHIGQPLPAAISALAYVTDFWSNYSGALSLLLHTWSLSVEEQFYLVWPLVLIFALRRDWRLERLLAVLAGTSILITFAIYSAHVGRLSNIQWLPTSHVPELAGGIFIAVIERQGTQARFGLLTALPAAVVGVVLLLIAEVALPARWWAFPLSTIACWPIVAHLVFHRDSVLSATFRWSPLVWLGRRSYGFYLWHYPVILLLARDHNLGPLIRAAIALPLVLVITSLSWQFVETPFLRMKHRFEPATPSGVT